jgi:hypothetical protein
MIVYVVIVAVDSNPWTFKVYGVFHQQRHANAWKRKHCPLTGQVKPLEIPTFAGAV